MPTIVMPERMTEMDGRRRYAYVTFLILNDSYLSGALLLAYGLRQQWTEADLICLVTPEITSTARAALGCLYDHVVEVEAIYVPHKRRHQRQDRPFWFTRMNALRLGVDGDLGLSYEKLVVLDADVLPMKWYDHLFTLVAPAGVINESKAHLTESDIVPDHIHQGTEWRWHRIYNAHCRHGSNIPKKITDRVALDPENNTGISGSLYVWEPSMEEYRRIRAQIETPEILELVADRFDYPDMQYLTIHWSGRWTSVDLRFIGFKGYPGIRALYGTHFAGFKPWYFNQLKALSRFSRYDDFKLWYRSYLAMVLVDFPKLQDNTQLHRLCTSIRELLEWEVVERRGDKSRKDKKRSARQISLEKKGKRH